MVTEFVPGKPIPVKERTSMIFVGRFQIDVRAGALVLVDEVNGERARIPVDHEGLRLVRFASAAEDTSDGHRKVPLFYNLEQSPRSFALVDCRRSKYFGNSGKYQRSVPCLRGVNRAFP